MFSVVIPGRPCLTDIVAVDQQPNGQATKFAFNFPSDPSLTDIVVFFLPGTILPQDTAAAIYVQLPDTTGPTNPEFKFVGALANEKPSSIIRIRDSESNVSSAGRQRTEAEEEDEMLDEGNNSTTGGSTPSGTVTLGISIEPVQTVAPQLAQLDAQNPRSEPSTDLVRQQPEQGQQKGVSTKVLAQRIIGNAFNFLASFAGPDSSGGKEDVVPLKSFRDWWSKFERKIEMDPSFLEKEDPNAV